MKIKFKIISALLFSSFLLSFAVGLQAALLDIGNEFDLEYRYLKATEDTSSQLRHRLRLYMKANLDNDIDIGGRIQSAGILNSDQNYITYDGRFVHNQAPFFDLAYIRLNTIYEYPVSLTLGIQELKWLDGLLINDAGMGLGGASAKTEAPLNIGLEGYIVFSSDRMGSGGRMLGPYTNNISSSSVASNIQGRGFRIYRYFDFVKAEFNYLTENYDDFDGSAERVTYGANLTRDMKEGLEFSLFWYLMEGEVGDDPLDSSLRGAYGNFEGRVEPLGKGGAWIRYIAGSGDTDDERKGFMPVLAYAEPDMIGHYYGRHRERDLSFTVANLDLFSYGLYAYPIEGLKISMTRSLYKSVDPDLPIGGSLSFGLSYIYDRIELSLKRTIFSPEEDHQFFEDKSSKRFITLNASARF